LLLPDTLARARKAGLDPRACLDAHRAYDVFEASDGLVVTGPTLTNVNDVRIVLVG
jgi:glycerate-2-kinase